MNSAKPCRHAGYLMRSQAECFWARVMDALRITWLYEPKVWETDMGLYLPDFYVPAAGAFVEVKGAKPSAEEIGKAEGLMRASGCPVVFAYGSIALGVFSGRLEVMGAALMVPVQSSWVSVPLGHVTDLVAGILGEREALAIACCARGQYSTAFLPRDRDALERMIASTALPLNQAKQSLHRAMSPAEVHAGIAATWITSRQQQAA